MFRISGVRIAVLLVVVLCASGCAGTESLLKAPSVNLSSVELSKINFSGQTFLLGFDVQNPNVFPLPIKKIRYRVMLENSKFAGGETQCNFTIPALGNGEFVISVDLDLLQSGAKLASIIRQGVHNDINYELDGSLTIDIPLDFSNSGTVVVQARRF
jgi:LEA14-like dessication related protein